MVLNKLTLVNAKFGYYYDKTLKKNMLGIHYVNQNNFQQVLDILPLIKISYTLSIGHTSLNKNDICALSKCNKMEILNLLDCPCSPDGSILKCLSTHKNLKELGLTARINSNIQLPARYVCDIPQIQSLRIIGSRISMEDIECIKEMYLINLDLTASSLSDDSISIIAKCDSIKSLSLDRCNFSNTSCIRKISQMNNIEILDLSRCKISAKVLDSFIGHSSLKKIIVEGTGLCADDIVLVNKKISGLPQIIGIFYSCPESLLRQEKPIEKEENEVKSNH